MSSIAEVVSCDPLYCVVDKYIKEETKGVDDLQQTTGKHGVLDVSYYGI